MASLDPINEPSASDQDGDAQTGKRDIYTLTDLDLTSDAQFAEEQKRVCTEIAAKAGQPGFTLADLADGIVQSARAGALREIKKKESKARAEHIRLNNQFKGVVRGIVVLRRMRLRAAQAAYAPGGAGAATAAVSFAAAAEN